MKKSDLLKDGNNIIRVLEIKVDTILIIDCIKRTMPVWVEVSALKSFIECTDEILIDINNFTVAKIDALDAEQRKIMYERYTLIAPILPFVADEKVRSKIICSIATEQNISKQTIRNYLCLYLTNMNITALAPKKHLDDDAKLTQDEKNIRWALNKFFYTTKKQSLIIGTSGTGKSSAISRAINLITENRVIEADNPYTQVVPCVMVQCPFDSSVKGLLLEILRKVDEALDTKYYQNALRARATTDMLIGSVSQVALNHIGMLVVDEIQNVVNSKNGKSLIGSLTQLINNSGISICMVGTPESTRFFESAMQLARRSVGLQYTTMSYDKYFQEFCKVMFQYQYVQKKSEITSEIIEWLYEHSAGVTSVVVALIHDAQEIAILNGKEILNLESLNEAYQQRLSLLHGYIQPSISQSKQTSKIKKIIPAPATMITEDENLDNNISIVNLVAKAKNKNIDIVQLLKNHMSVVEVAI